MANTPVPTNELQMAGNERTALLHVTQQSWASVRTNKKGGCSGTSGSVSTQGAKAGTVEGQPELHGKA